ncbi:hypothetical protein [Pseudonocardia sichuanensis]
MQTSLLGDEIPVPSPRRPPQTNDLRCVEQVLRTAVETGYMLGPDGKVARKLGDSAVTPVPAAEAAAVRQLIASRHLTTGGHHAVELGGRTVSALAVLVPRATRDLVSRWCSYKPLGGSTERG